MFIECFKLDLDIGGLHDLVNFAVFLPADELTMLVGELNLEANLMMERLTKVGRKSGASVSRQRTLTLTISRSRSKVTAERTSCSSPCISKDMPLNTTSAPVAYEICLRMAETCVGFKVVEGMRTLN